MSRSGPASAPTSPAVGTVGHRVTSRSSSPPTNVMAIASVVNHAPAQTPSARSARTNPRGKIVKIGASAVPGHTSTRQSGRRASHQMLQGDGSITNAVWTDPAPQDPAQASIATSSRNQHTVEPHEQPDPPSTRFSENWARWQRSVGNQYKCMHMKGARPCNAKLFDSVAQHVSHCRSAHLLNKEITCPEPGCAKVLLGGKPSDLKRHFNSEHSNITFDLGAWLKERKSAKKR